MQQEITQSQIAGKPMVCRFIGVKESDIQSRYEKIEDGNDDACDQLNQNLPPWANLK